MTLIIETGIGRPDADSYISVADASTYHANRGNVAWAALPDDLSREQALRKATDYLEQAYRARWAGQRVSTTQALAWPRAWVPMKDAPGGYGTCSTYYPSDAVPADVKRACAELALKAATGTALAPDVKPLATRVKVGPIEKEFAAGSRQATRYTAIEGMLSAFFGGSGGALNIGVVRA